MAKRKPKARGRMPAHHCSRKKMIMGGMIFLFGLVRYMGYSWEMSVMTLGALVFLKGLLMELR